MRAWRRRPRVLIVVLLAMACAGAGAIVAPARATSTFSLDRLAGTNRYQTAGLVDHATYSSGEPEALLADAVPGHQSDALAAAGAEGVYGLGVLLTDNSDSVPTDTLSALSTNKVKKVVVVGGLSAVSQSQIKQLTDHGYTVSTPYQGSDRYQTMAEIDQSMGGAGTDGSGLKTGILASGEDPHLVDALSAGGLAYSKHFPVILTDSAGPGLQPEAAQVISSMGIQHLIVVGGTASVPSSEYSPPPSGVTKVDVEAGADRSQTSTDLANFAIASGWLSATNLVLARGDDGADALGGAPLAGSHGWPTILTNSVQDSGSVVRFASQHQPTLAGASYILGGTAAVSSSQQSAVQVAGQNSNTPSGLAAPLSLSTTDSAAPSADLGPGVTLTVTFNEPVVVASQWSLNLATPCSPTGQTCNPGTNPVTLNEINSTASVKGDTLTIALGADPQGPDMLPDPSVVNNELEVVSTTGITSGPSAGNLRWNLPGSAVAGVSGYNRVFNGDDSDIPTVPNIYSVNASSAADPNTVEFQCGYTDTYSELNVYSLAGVLLGSAPCESGRQTLTVTPPSGSGRISFSSGTTYLFTEEDSTAPTTSGTGMKADVDAEGLATTATAG